MPTKYQTLSEKYESAIVPCIYCLQGRCAERKAAGLCHCGDHIESTLQTASSSTSRTSKESELATGN